MTSHSAQSIQLMKLQRDISRHLYLGEIIKGMVMGLYNYIPPFKVTLTYPRAVY